MRFWHPRTTGKKLTVAAALAAVLAMAPAALQAQFPASLDVTQLDGSNGFAIEGFLEDHHAGELVDDVGDFNGDGIDDVIIGATGGSPNGNTRSGQCFVVFGDNSGFSASFGLESINGTNGVAINGINPSDLVGGSLSGAGDFNGDGINDVIVATLGSSFPPGRTGFSCVVFGSNSGLPASIELSSLDGTNGIVINSIVTGGYGGTVSGGGDINADGFDDVAISFSPVDSGAGATYVLFGNSSGSSAPIDLNALNGTNGFKVCGRNAFDFTRGLMGAGDVNGDGIDDLIIGASGADPNGMSSAGETYVVFGTNSGFSASFDLNSLNGSNGFTINGIAAGDDSGLAVSGAGDVNGDGTDDLIIGAPDSDLSGATYVVFGNSSGFSSSLDLGSLNGTNGFVVNGIDSRHRIGGSFSGAGDINGDGFDDLMIGAKGTVQRDSETYVVFGKNGGFSPSLDPSTLDGTNGFVLSGGPGFVGTTLSNAGDLNGDGLDDVIVGTYQFFENDFLNRFTFDEGVSYVVFGRSSVPDILFGDVDQNGAVNFFDIAPFISVLASEDYLVEADINEDGAVDFFDISPFIDLLASQE